MSNKKFFNYDFFTLLAIGLSAGMILLRYGTNTVQHIIGVLLLAMASACIVLFIEVECRFIIGWYRMSNIRKTQRWLRSLNKQDR